MRRRAPGGRFLSRYDVRGLAPDGKTYTVEAGDTPGGVAQELTGQASRYTELFAANPQKPTVQKPYGRNFKTFTTGEVIKLPASWWPTTITGDDDDDEVTAAETVKSKAILVAWCKSDGQGLGPSAYGTSVADMTADWTTRDGQALTAFVKATGNGSLDGELRQEDVDNLAEWAEGKASTEPDVVGGESDETDETVPENTINVPGIGTVTIPEINLPTTVPAEVPTSVSIPDTVIVEETEADDDDEDGGGGLGAVLPLGLLALAALVL